MQGNIGIGSQALYSNTYGPYDVAIGYQAMFSVDGGGYSTAIGYQSMKNATGGSNNNVIGFQSLYKNTTGAGNSSLGHITLQNNTTGSYNSAVGFQTMSECVSGNNNSAFGSYAMMHNSTGTYSTGIGTKALFTNTSGSSNTALGSYAGNLNFSGSRNTFIGDSAGYANLSGNNNIFIGYQAGLNETGSNKLYIANSGTTKPLILGDFGSSPQTMSVNGRLGIGVNTINVFTPSTPLHIAMDAVGTQDMIRLQRQNDVSPSADMSNITFYHENSAHALINYGQMTFNVEDVTDASEVGSIVFYTQNKGAKKALTINKDGGIESEGIIQAKSGITINGGSISQLIGTSIIRDIPSIGAGASRVETFTVTGSTIGAAVLFNPLDALSDGILIAYSRVSATDIVEAKFTNITASPVDPPSNTFRIEVFRP